MATESAIFPELSVVCSIFAISASMRSGCRRFLRRPWPTLGYDISNYLGVDSYSVRWTISIDWSLRRMREI